ncbi:Apoptotic chromatin condensation inducer in the nucleus [Halotydeus destructor]|nr:Apoptotic chromatin condensation inducer in the nucleus [Halotydeus destructor]
MKEELMIDGKPLSSLRVVDLKKELEKRGISKSGTKKELVDKLKMRLELDNVQHQEAVNEGGDAVPNVGFNDDIESSNNDYVKAYLAEQQATYQKQIEIKQQVMSETVTEPLPETSAQSSIQQEPTTEVPQVVEMVTATEAIPEESESVALDLAHSGKTEERSIPSKDDDDTTQEATVQDSEIFENEVKTEEPTNLSKNQAETVEAEAVVDATHEAVSDLPDASKLPAANQEKSEQSISDSKSGEAEPPKITDHHANVSATHTEKSLTVAPAASETKPEKVVIESDGKMAATHLPSENVSETPEVLPTHVEHVLKKPEVSEKVGIEDQADLPKVAEHSTEESLVKEDKDSVELKTAGKNDSSESQALPPVVVDQARDEKLPVEKKAEASKPLESKTEGKEVTEASEEPSKPEKRQERKRRWGGSKGESNSVGSGRLSRGISSDALKGLISDSKKTSNQVSESAASETQREESTVTENATVELPTNTNLSGSGKSSGLVVEDAVDKRNSKLVPVAIERKISESNDTSLLADVEPEKPREPSPAKKTPTNILFIKNLTRPFTLNQLYEVLSKNGEVEKEKFWIDKIKSKCYATYSSIAHATAAREGLHGLRWPDANPKTLWADFASEEDVDKERNPVVETKVDPPKAVDNRRERKEPEKDRDEESKVENNGKREAAVKRPVREWDKEKLQMRDRESSPSSKRRRSRSPANERRRDVRSDDKSGQGGAKPKEPIAPEPGSPAKMLDDLFRKTKALPCLYWLPLTEEQVSARIK